MEFDNFFHLGLFRKRMVQLLSKIRSTNQKTGEAAQILRTIRGFVYLLMSVIGTWISIDLTSSRSIQNYRSDHWPHQTTWIHTLQSRGLVLRENLGPYTKLLETNPSAFTRDSQIWITEDLCALLVPSSPYHSGSEFWTCTGTKTLSPWIKLGGGLKGYEKLVELFENSPIKSIPKLSKISKNIDPKEFHY